MAKIKYVFMSSFVKYIVFLSLFSLPCVCVNAARKTFTLVVDAGHGGHDTGCQGAYANEKNINLAVAQAFGKMVSRKCRDVRVVYTRSNDTFISLQGRCDVANSNNADLFISIHVNSVALGGSLVRGTETYFYGAPMASNDNSNEESTSVTTNMIAESNRRESELLARYIQQEYIRSGRASRGVKQAHFYVLVHTNMPSVLTEIGFITAQDEEAYMTSSNGINEICEDIFQAFQRYRKQANKGTALRRIRGVSDKALGSLPANSRTSQMDADKEEVTPKVSSSSKRAQRKKRKQEEEDMDLRDDVPVFCIQLFATSRKIPDGDGLFKGLTQIGTFAENGLNKYIYYSSNDYNLVLKRKREIADKFPDAFIIAFKKSERMDVNKAIREFLRNKNR